VDASERERLRAVMEARVDRFGSGWWAASRGDAGTGEGATNGEVLALIDALDAAEARETQLWEALDVYEVTIDRIGSLVISDRSAHDIVAVICEILDEHDDVLVATRAAGARPTRRRRSE